MGIPILGKMLFILKQGPESYTKSLYPAQSKVVGGYMTRFHSVRPSRILCPLCSTYSSGWIHFISMHLIKQLQKVCCLYSWMQTFIIWIFGNFSKFVTLNLSCFDLGSDVNHGAAGVSQNAGILVVPSYNCYKMWYEIPHTFPNWMDK